MKKATSLPKLKAKCQLVFNEFIRLRDKDQPCISCGQFKPLQAGHYYSVKGYDGIRYDEHNVNGECEYCNYFNESHLIGYGIRLTEKLGLDKYNDLIQRAADYKRNGYKWSRTELEEKIKYYSELIKGMR